MKGWKIFGLAALMLAPTQAFAKPVTDCPNRDAAYSVHAPLIDLLANPSAGAIVDRALGSKRSLLPPRFFSAQAPSFAAIVTLEKMMEMLGGDTANLAAIDKELRQIPVTADDKVARCARFDNDVPQVSLPAGKPRLLLFEKITGFKDTPSVDAATAALTQLAERKGWALFRTDKAGIFNPESLRQFDGVIWSNNSGDVLTLSQQAAFKSWIEAGGAYIGIHGAGGDPVFFWDWYADKLLGARFIGHPAIQEGRIQVNQTHPLTRGLPSEWSMMEEWYSFDRNPGLSGAQVILSLDEGSYKPEAGSKSLRMGEHPLAWTRCVGRGRMFYSAIGHVPAVYANPNVVTLMENGIQWAATDKKACSAHAD